MSNLTYTDISSDWITHPAYVKTIKLLCDETAIHIVDIVAGGALSGGEITHPIEVAKHINVLIGIDCANSG
jgi:hypothetical protein